MLRFSVKVKRRFRPKFVVTSFAQKGGFQFSEFVLHFNVLYQIDVIVEHILASRALKLLWPLVVMVLVKVTPQVFLL